MDILARGEGHVSNVRHCLVDDANDRIITVSAEKIVRCWDSNTFCCIQVFRDNRRHRPDDMVTAALWDDSRSSLILGGSMLGAWKNVGAIQFTTRTHEAPVTAALYNTHFHQVVSGDAMGNVHVWLVETGQLTFRFAGAHGSSKMSCMCFDSSERRLLTGASDGAVKMWNFSNGKERGEYVATCSWDKHVRIFDIGSQSDGQLACQQLGYGGNNVKTPSRIFPRDHRLRYCGSHGLDRYVGGGGGRGGRKAQGVGEGHSADILSIAHCGHHQVATGGLDGRIFVWATDSGKAKFSMQPSDHGLGEERSVDTSVHKDQVAAVKLAESAPTADKITAAADVAVATTVDDTDETPRGCSLLKSRNTGLGTLTDQTETNRDKAVTAVVAVEASPTTSANVSGDADLDSFGAYFSSDNGRAGFQSRSRGGILTPSAPRSTVTASSVGGPNVPREAEPPETGEGGPSVGRKAGERDKTHCEQGPTTNGGEVSPRMSSPRKLNRGGGNQASPLCTPVEKLFEGAASHTVDCLLYIRCHQVLVSATASGELHFWDASTGAFIFNVPMHHPNDAGASALGSSEEAETEYSGCDGGNIGGGHVVRGDGGGGGGGGGGDGGGGGGTVLGAVRMAGTASSANLKLYTACEEGYVKTWKVGDLTKHAYETGFRERPKLPQKARVSRGGKGLAPPSFFHGTKSKSTRGMAVRAQRATNPGGGQGSMPLAETSKANSATPSANPVKANPSSLLQPVQQWQAHETMVTSVEGVNYRGKLDLLVTAGVDSYVHLWTVDGAHVGTFGQPSGPWSLGSRATWRDPTSRALLIPCGAKPRKENIDRPTATIRSTAGDYQESRASRGENKHPHRTRIHNGGAASEFVGEKETGKERHEDGGRGRHDRDTDNVTDHKDVVDDKDVVDGMGVASDEEALAGDKVVVHDKKHGTDSKDAVDVKNVHDVEDFIVDDRAAHDDDVVGDRDIDKEREENEQKQRERYYAASLNRVQRKLNRGRLDEFCVSRGYCKEERLQHQEVKQDSCTILAGTAKKKSPIHHCQGPFSAQRPPILGNKRIASILRNTYNQVSFQLQLHKHEDVDERVEATLARRKSRPRARGANTIHHHHYHHHPHHRTSVGSHRSAHASATATFDAETLPKTSPRKLATGRITPESVRGEADGIVSVENGKSRNICSPGGASGGGCGGGEGRVGGVSRGVIIMEGDYDVPPMLESRGGKGSEGAVRPAAPVHPSSSAATFGGRRFRSSSGVAAAGGRGKGA